MSIRALLAALLVLGAVAFGLPAVAAAAPVGALRICNGCASTGDLTRYGYVILHGDQHQRMRALKAANPQLKVLLYKNMSATYSYMVQNGRDARFLPAGVGYRFAHDHHPEWFALDAGGQRVQFAHYPGLWLMDVGSAAYQQAWLSAVAAELSAHGWDGVMIDDANVSPRFQTGGRRLQKYPKDADWAAATRSFLARVGPQLQRNGFLVLPNIFTEWPNGHQIWQDWLQFTSGGVQEYWTKWGSDTTGHFAGADWTYRQRFLSITQALGKTYLGITYAPMSDVRSMRYARASFLLDWDGRSSALIYEHHPGPTDPWAAEWTQSIGTPLGSRQQVGAAWRRNYTGGVALVNPSTGPVTVNLGGTFLLPDGSSTSSVTLAAASGLVLRSAAAAPVSLSAPRISRTARAGRTLTASVGSWSGSPEGFAFQWLRCSSSGGPCVPVAGATARTYALLRADVGSTLRVRVEATNAHGSGSGTSGKTARVRRS